MLIKLKLEINLRLFKKNFDHLDNGAYKCAVSGFEGEVSKSVYINGLFFNF